MDIIDVGKRLVCRGNAVTVPWTAAHKGVGGSEMADVWARGRRGARPALWAGSACERQAPPH